MINIMEAIVNKFITHSLSGDDILNICDGQAKLLTNTDLNYVKNKMYIVKANGKCVKAVANKVGSFWF